MKFLTILLAIVALTVDNATAVSFKDFYGYPDTEMPIPEPAVGSLPIYLSPSLPYYGIQYDCCIVYVDGRVGLYMDSSQSNRCYLEDQKRPENEAIIAPFNGVISEGSVTYSNTTNTNSSLRSRAEEQINNNFTDFNNITLEYLLIATWKDVTIGDGDGENTFQVVIATNGTKSFALFLYDKLEIMGTTNPRVYFNGTDCNDESVLWEMPCSGTSDITAMADTSNVEVPGMWAFRIDKDITPACTDKESCEEDGLCSCLLDDTSEECLCNGDRSGSSITNMSVGITLLLWYCWFFEGQAS